MIPTSALAAILIYSGWRLIVNTNLKAIYKKGRRYYVPFVATILFIIFSNVLVGVLVVVFVGV